MLERDAASAKEKVRVERELAIASKELAMVKSNTEKDLALVKNNMEKELAMVKTNMEADLKRAERDLAMTKLEKVTTTRR